MIGRKWRAFRASASLLAHAVGRLLWEPSRRGDLTIMHSHSPWRRNSHTGAYLRGGEDPLMWKAPFTFGRTQREAGGGRSDLSPSLENPQRFGTLLVGLFVAAGGRQNHGCFSFGENLEKTSGDQHSGSSSSSSAEISVAIVIRLGAGQLELT